MKYWHLMPTKCPSLTSHYKELFFNFYGLSTSTRIGGKKPLSNGCNAGLNVQNIEEKRPGDQEKILVSEY